MYQITSSKRIRAKSSLALLLTMNLYILIQILFVIHFFINRQYFASEVCVRKNIKNNCCQGSCVLEKNINTTPNKDAENNKITTWFPEYIVNYLNIILGSVESNRVTFKLEKTAISKGFIEIFEKPPSLF